MSHSDNYFQTGEYEPIEQHGTPSTTLSIFDFQVPSLSFSQNGNDPWTTNPFPRPSESRSGYSNVSGNDDWNMSRLTMHPSAAYDISTLPAAQHGTIVDPMNYPSYDKPSALEQNDYMTDNNEFQASVVMRKTPIPPTKLSRKGSGRRKPFEPLRREEVAMTRSIGACIICRTLRVKCDKGIPCRRCIKEFEGATLTFGVCWRQTLLSARFNNVDLLRVSSYKRLVENIQSPLVSKYVASSFSACCGPVEHPQYSYYVQSELESTMPLDEFGPQAIGCTFKSRQLSTIPYGQSFGERPDLEVFLQHHPVSGHEGLTGPFSRLHKAFGLFAEKSRATKALAIKDPLTVQCLDLNRELDKYHKSADGQQNSSALQSAHPNPINAFQIKYGSGQAAYNLEMEILQALEKRLYKSGNDKRNPLSIWICLWILLLSYQEHMHFTKYFNNHDKRMARPLHELAKHMFNGLTTIYATFFRDESPLADDWNTAEIMKELGHDQALFESFLNIKSEIKMFYAEKDDLSKHDTLFKILVAEPECKLLSL